MNLSLAKAGHAASLQAAVSLRADDTSHAFSGIQARAPAGTGSALAAETSSEPMFLSPTIVSALFPSVAGDTSWVGSIPFSEAIRGTAPMPLDREMTVLSMDVYETDSAGPSELYGWERQTELSGSMIENLGLEERSDGTWENPETGLVFDPKTGLFTGPQGFQAALYAKDGCYVLAFAGSDEKVDWTRTNIPQSLGLGSKQYEMAMDLAIGIDLALTEDGSPGSLAFTGHSLGGGLASAAAYATGLPAVTFNAAGVAGSGSSGWVDTVALALDKRKEAYGDAPNEADAVAQAGEGQIRAYYVGGEILHLVQDEWDGEMRVIGGVLSVLVPISPVGQILIIGSTAPGAAGEQIEIDDPNGGSRVDRHMGDSVTDAVDASLPMVLGETVDENGNPVVTVGDPAASALFVATGGDPYAMSQAFGMNDAYAEGTQVTTVTFENSPQGRQAAAYFKQTGTLPPGGEGVLQVTVIERRELSGGSRMTETVPNGTATIDDDHVIETQVGQRSTVEGAPKFEFTRELDANGETVPGSEAAVFTFGPIDRSTADFLNQAYGLDPPLSEGDSVILTFDAEDLSTMTSADHERLLDGEPVLGPWAMTEQPPTADVLWNGLYQIAGDRPVDTLQWLWALALNEFDGRMPGEIVAVP